jgi:SAM-dependent methyltransferase
MNPADLPVVGPPQNTDKDYLAQFTDLAGKRVLCVGYSEVEIDELVAKYNPGSIEVLTNWEGHKDADVGKYQLTIGDITKRTPYADDHFDSILTLSVLEHLDGLRGACEEMRRIVRNGGEILHLFGPAWSSPYGHHCYAKPGDRLLDFCQWSIPAHIHLLCSRAEIVDYFIGNGYGIGDTNTALHWYFETPMINRLFFDVYADTLTEFFQPDRAEYMRTVLPADHLARLREHYPGRRDFSTYGAKFRLIVSK